MSGSDDFEDDDEEEGEGEGHTRRNWAERRARLRKDGMHGRRLPPPQAEEERATAKAEKREAKKAAKEAQKERRKTKIKKHVKQQRIKHTSGNKKK
ncbi:unnamed protein product [Ectocarpus sp. 6 AP-2014]